MVVDNSAVNRIVSENLLIKNPSYNHSNQLLSQVFSAATSSLRFPTFQYNDMASIVSALVPINPCHFITATYTPFVDETSARISRKTTVSDVIRRLVQEKNALTSLNPSKRDVYFSMLSVLRGSGIDSSEVNKSIMRLREKNGGIQFASWTPSAPQVCMVKQTGDQHNAGGSSFCGLMLANHSSVSKSFGAICDQFDRLKRRNAFLDQYRKEAMFSENLDEFTVARETVQSLIDTYDNAAQFDYF